MAEFAGYLAIGLMVGGLYSLVALGFVLVYQSTGVFNLSQPWIVPLGAYFAFFAFRQLQLPLWAGFPLVLVAAALTGYVLQRLTIRPLFGQSMLAIVLMTLGLAVILQGIMVMVWGFDSDIVPRFYPVGGVNLGTISLSYDHLLSFAIAIVLMAFLFGFNRYSRSGLAMRVTAESHVVAQSLGIRVTGVAALSWVIAAMVAAIGGMLLANIMSIDTSMLDIGVRAIAVVLVGGLESPLGAILGGLLIGVVETVAAGYIDPLIGGGFRDVAAYIVLLIALLARPYGFFGWKRIERV